MKAVIPAAGLGTRFLPITKAIPKELLPVFDVPAAQLVVEEALSSGSEQIILVLGPGKEALLRHFGPQTALVDELRARGKHELAGLVASSAAPVASVVQERALGLGHAILCARPLVGDEPFAVLLPDDVFDAAVPVLRQLLDRHAQSGRSVIALEEVPASEVRRYGIVRPAAVDGRLVQVEDVVEKPAEHEAPSRLAIPGRYVLLPEVFDWIERTPPGHGGEIQLTDALREMARRGRLEGLRVEATRLDAGEPMGLLEAGIHRALKHPQAAARLRAFLRDLPKE